MFADLAALKALKLLILTPNPTDIGDAINIGTVKEEGKNAGATALLSLDGPDS
jgi:hypothetical protein